MRVAAHRGRERPGLRLSRCPRRLDGSAVLQAAASADQRLPHAEAPSTLPRAVLLAPEPAPARKLLIKRGHLAKLFPHRIVREEIVHGHLLSAVPRAEADTAFA